MAGSTHNFSCHCPVSNNLEFKDKHLLLPELLGLIANMKEMRIWTVMSIR